MYPCHFVGLRNQNPTSYHNQVPLWDRLRSKQFCDYYMLDESNYASGLTILENLVLLRIKRSNHWQLIALLFCVLIILVLL